MASPERSFEEFMASANGSVKQAPPRMFALVEEQDCEYGQVFAWGMALKDGAIVVRPGGCAVHWHQSAENALRFFSRIAEVHLVWCQPSA